MHLQIHEARLNADGPQHEDRGRRPGAGCGSWRASCLRSVRSRALLPRRLRDHGRRRAALAARRARSRSLRLCRARRDGDRLVASRSMRCGDLSVSISSRRCRLISSSSPRSFCICSTDSRAAAARRAASPRRGARRQTAHRPPPIATAPAAGVRRPRGRSGCSARLS